MLNALRLSHGFDLSLFKERTGLSELALLDELELAQDQGFLQINNDRLIKTEKGEHFLNDLLQLFLQE